MNAGSVAWLGVCQGPLLDALFDADLPVGLAFLDREFRYLRVNHALSQFNGTPRDLILGRSVAEVLPEAYPTLEPLLLAVLNEGVALERFKVLAEVPSSPGELSEWEASYLPVFDADRQVQGILVQAVNVTVQQRSQRLLLESEARLRRVLDSLFAFVGVLSPQGVILDANQAPLDAAGITLQDVQGRFFWDAYWWSYDPGLQAWLQQAIVAAASGEVVRKDVVVRMRGDTRVTIDFMLAPLRDESGVVTHLIPSGTDVSDRVASVRALRASEARFRSAFSAAPDGLVLVDAQGSVLLANLRRPSCARAALGAWCPCPSAPVMGGWFPATSGIWRPVPWPSARSCWPCARMVGSSMWRWA
jgi:PAS domain S-box-containing protein